MYEIEYCMGMLQLTKFIDKCNKCKYQIISMVLEGAGYTILYKKEE